MRPKSYRDCTTVCSECINVLKLGSWGPYCTHEAPPRPLNGWLAKITGETWSDDKQTCQEQQTRWVAWANAQKVDEEGTCEHFSPRTSVGKTS